MRANKFEDAVWKKDGVRVVVRAPAAATVVDYENLNAAAGTLSVTGFLGNRILPKVNPFEAVVILGDGTIAHGRTKLTAVRQSYVKDKAR